MTDDDYDGASTFTQSMTFRGNVIVQGTTQSNTSQIIAVYNDARAAGLTLNVTLLYNTFVGPTGGRAALVHLSNADGTTMNAELDDNIIAGTTVATHVEMTSVGKVTGTHNWLPTGADATGLAATLFGANPGFTNAAQDDFTLASGSPAVGAAMALASGAPDHEYFRDETVTRMYRLRATAHDIGAFESTTTGAGVGPNGGVATGPDGGAGGSSGAGGTGSGVAGRGGAGTTGAGTGGSPGGSGGSSGGAPGSGGAIGSGGSATGAGGTTAPGSGGGCGCQIGARPGSAGGLIVGAALLFAARRRRRS